MTQRTERIDQLLRQEISQILAKEIADPEIGFATVTEVETAPDLRHARVWFSVIGQKAEREQTLRALDRAMGYVRRELGTRLRLRRIPELHVRLDDSVERGTRVLQLINELEEGRSPDAAAPPDESLPTPVARIKAEGEPETSSTDAVAGRPRRSRRPRPRNETPKPTGRTRR
jgi:ribosome-binding factor A